MMMVMVMMVMMMIVIMMMQYEVDQNHHDYAFSHEDYVADDHDRCDLDSNHDYDEVKEDNARFLESNRKFKTEAIRRR